MVLRLDCFFCFFMYPFIHVMFSFGGGEGGFRGPSLDGILWPKGSEKGLGENGDV